MELLKLKSNIYEIKFSSPGGLYMPIILGGNFEDGSSEKIYIPAEIWKMNAKEVSKVFFFNQKVKEFNLDPNLETADVDRNNNYWPPRIIPSKFKLYKDKKTEQLNEMQKAKKN